MTDWQHGFYKLSADDRRQQLTEARQLSSIEALVVVDAIIGRVLDLVLKIVLVHHLMKECRGGFLNRAVERGRRC